MHRRNPHHRVPSRNVAPPARDARLARPLAGIALGLTVAIAVVGAGAYVFGPFSDLSVRQLAAGPPAAHPPDALPAIVYARTGRAWRAEAQRRVAAAASAPIARVARTP